MKKGANFNDISERIEELIDLWEVKLLQLPFEVRTERYNNQNRTIKQILGHLIDSAANNHQRIVRLQYCPKLEFPDYRQDNDTWIDIQKYQNEDWSLMINFWKYYNLHMVHLFLHINPECLKNTWTDFESSTVSLREMIEGYLVHLELHLLEISDLIKRKE
jgi:hypothetical protein